MTTYETNSGTTERFGWEENETDAESGFVNMGARMYMPEIGRFLAPDPLSNMMAFTSPYQYAFNNPVMMGDPSGMAPEKNVKNGDRLLSGNDDLYDCSQGSSSVNPCARNAVKVISAEWKGMVDCDDDEWLEGQNEWSVMWEHIHQMDMGTGARGGSGGGLTPLVFCLTRNVVTLV